jgi:hypothetical protein
MDQSCIDHLSNYMEGMAAFGAEAKHREMFV